TAQGMRFSVPLGDFNLGADGQAIDLAGTLPGTLRGRLDVAIPAEARVDLYVVATKDDSERDGTVISAPVSGGRYELQLPAGDYRIGVEDAMLGVRLHELVDPVHVVAGESTVRNLALPLHRVDVELVPPESGIPCVGGLGLSARDEQHASRARFGF